MSDEQCVVPNHLQNLIDEVCKNLYIRPQIKIEAISPLKPGDNWLGQILEINVVGKNHENQPVTLNLVAKLAPKIQLYRNFFPIEAIYKREIYMYNTVLPEFIKIQQENNIKTIFASFPRCYQTFLDKPHETIVLENMKTLGYQQINHQNPVDYQHASMLMKAAGKMHAISFALRNQKPELLKDLSANTNETFWNGKGGLRNSFFEILKTMGTGILTYLEKDSVAYNRFKKFINNPAYVVDELVHPEPAGEYAVICHGDIEIRNTLFKYEDELDSQNPTDLCLLDWQLPRFCSPVLDISLFIWISTDKEFRDRHYKDLIEIYYNSFSSFLRELGGDPEKSFPLKIFNDHLKKFSVYALFVAVWIVAMNLTDSENIPDVYSAENPETITDMLSTVPNKTYFTRIVDIIEDFIEYDYDF